jgi:hypothetical protein
MAIKAKKGGVSIKRTPFCAGKMAIKAKKRGVSTQETAGTGVLLAARGDVLPPEGETGVYLARWRMLSRVIERAQRAPCVLKGDGVGMLRSFGSPRWTDWFSGRAGLSVLPCSAPNDFLAMFLHGVRGIARVNDQARVPHNGRIIIGGIVRGNDYYVVFRQGFRSLTGQGTFGIKVPPVAPQGATFFRCIFGKREYHSPPFRVAVVTDTPVDASFRMI